MAESETCKDGGRCRWQRDQISGPKFRAQLGSRESGLVSKQPKKDFGQEMAKMLST